MFILELRKHKAKIKTIFISSAEDNQYTHFRTFFCLCEYLCTIKSNFLWFCAFFSLILYRVYFSVYYIVYKV